MSIKNLIIKGVLGLCRFFPRYEGERFLVVSTTGLGDTLWGTPAIRALRRLYPKAYIGILTSELGKEVLKGNRHIDEFFVVGEPAIFSLVRLFWKIRKRRIATVFVFHTSQRAVLPFCNLIGASKIVGTRGINKGLDDVLTIGLENRPMHEIERRLQIVGIPNMTENLDLGPSQSPGAGQSQLACISNASNVEIVPAARDFGSARNQIFSHVRYIKADDLSMELMVSERDRELAELLLRGVPDYIPLVGLHPGAKDRFKQWPPEHFIEVGKRLKAHLGCQIIVTGGKDEKSLVGKVARGIEGAIPIAGQLSVHALGALIRKFSLMIANDTGPMHIAFAMKTPVIGLFTPTDYKLCGPYFVPSAVAIQKGKTCTPCLKKRCRDPFCLLQISKDEVFQAALRMFYGK